MRRVIIMLLLAPLTCCLGCSSMEGGVFIENGTLLSEERLEEPGPSSVSMIVEGMKSQADADRLYHALSHLPAVQDVIVNAETGGALISVRQGDMVDYAAFRQAVRENGFRLREISARI